MLVAQWKYSVRARCIALALAACFLWVCTGGTLRHSDGCVNCNRLLAVAAQLSTTAQTAPHAGFTRGIGDGDQDTACAACQWTQVARDLPHDHALALAATTVAYEMFVGVMPAKPSLPAVCHACLRAPPAALC